MAELAPALSLGAQLRLLGRLRWDLFRNSLRSTEGRLDLAALIVIGGLAAIGAAGLGLVFGVGAYQMVARNRPQQLGLLLAAVFLFWQIFPLIQGAISAPPDLRTLRCFPLRFSTFVCLHLGYALLDSVTLVSLCWLVCVAVGAVWAENGLLLYLLLFLPLLATIALLLNRLVLGWLEPALQRRRTRERLVVVFFLALVLVPAAGTLLDDREKELAALWQKAAPVLDAFPPALAARGVAAGAGAGVAEAIAPAAGLMVYLALLGVVLARRFRVEYLGEEFGETPAAEPGQLVSSLEPGWAIPGLSDPQAAVLEKEWRYLYRNPFMLLNVLGPLIATGLFVVITVATPRSPFNLTTDLLFPGILAYSVFGLLQPSHNSLGFDGGGVQMLLLAPVTFRDVLLAKNLALTVVTLSEAVVLWLMVSYTRAAPTVVVAAASLAALLFLLPVDLAAGNLLSLYFPLAIGGKLSSRRQAELTTLVGFALKVVLLGFCGGLFYRLRSAGQMTAAPAVFLLMAAVAMPFYWRVLARCSEIAADRRDILLNRLCRG